MFIALVTVTKGKIAHAKFLCISLVNRKLNSLISMFSQSWYMRGMKRVKKDILLTFDGAANVSRTFLSALGQLQHRSFLK